VRVDNSHRLIANTTMLAIGMPLGLSGDDILLRPIYGDPI